MLPDLGLRTCRIEAWSIYSYRKELTMAKSRSSGGRSKNSSAKSAKGKYRSAVTGKYVSSHYGKRHPKTTVRESK